MGTKKNAQEISVKIIQQVENIDINPAKLKNLVKYVCSRFKVNMASINIVVTDDAGIQKINDKFLGLNSPTDVISFDLTENKDTDCAKCFDLAVNAEKAVREAMSRDHCKESELALYVTHGLLHNLGFDDATEKQAEKMHKTENEILQESGFGSVYNS
jgi:probable rRNA maturation factor